MKRIAIFTCLKATETCAGCGCMKAYHKKTGTFEEYKDTEAELLSFFHCSHCIDELDPVNDEGLLKKLERLVTEGVERVHVGICTQKNGVKCTGAEKIEALLHEKGIETVQGTHPRHGNRPTS